MVDVTKEELATNDGSSLVGFNHPGNEASSTVLKELVYFIRPEQFGAVGDGVTDDTAAIQAADDFAAVNGAEVRFAAKTYKTTAKISKDRKTTWRGEGVPFPVGTYNPGNARVCGTIIFKAHSDHGVEVIGSGGYSECGAIFGIAISSDLNLYPTGDGFRIDLVGLMKFEDCQVWSVGGNGFTNGVTNEDVTGHTQLRNCYVNNCGGKAFQNRAKWSRLTQCISDGCTHGFYGENSPETHIIDCHFEGFSVAGAEFGNGCGSSRFVGKTIIANTALAPCGVEIANDPGNFQIDLTGVKLIGPSTATGITFSGPLSQATSAVLNTGWHATTGSYGIYFSDGSVRTATLTENSTSVSWSGAVTASASAVAMAAPGTVAVSSSARGTSLHSCEIYNWSTGILSAGQGLKVRDCYFYQCGLPIVSGQTDSHYHDNNFDGTPGLYEIEHAGGSDGIWTGNNFGPGKLIKPTVTGAQGDFDGIRVSGNINYKTRNVVSLNMESGVPQSHGLVGEPIMVHLTPFSVGATSPIAVAFTTDKNFTPVWSGSSPLGVNAEIFCKCDAI